MPAFYIKFISLLVSALLFLFSWAPPISDALLDASNNYAFALDAREPGAVLGNKVSDMNTWMMQGVPAQSAFVEADPMAFTEYIQLMQCTGGSAERDLFAQPLNNAVRDDYDFSALITACENVLRLGAKPHLKTGNVPLKLTTDPKIGVFGVNVYPPDDYNEYAAYIRAIAAALVDRFGLEEVQSWRFGVLTEFENADWFMARSEKPEDSFVEYCKLYDYTLSALQDVLGEAVDIGAHAMAVSEGLWDEGKFIEHCAKGTNYATGLKGSRLCFMNASYYDSNPGKLSKRNLAQVIGALRDKAESVGLTDLRYGVDEGRILSASKGGQDSQLLQRMVGQTYQAAFDARLLTSMARNDIAYFSSWGYLSGGMFSGFPSVAYHVADRYAALLSDKQMVTTSALKTGYMLDSEVDVLAGVNPADASVALMAYNFKADLAYNRSADMQITLDLPQGYGTNATVTAYVVDDDANFFDEWEADRTRLGIGAECFAWSPDDPAVESTTTLNASWARDIYFNQLREGYIENARLVPTQTQQTVANGKLTLEFRLAPSAVVFFEIVPA